MKQLKKTDRKRFDAVCTRLRKLLHLEHWEHDYVFGDDDTIASCHCPPLGNRYVWITINEPFWKESSEGQLRTLIHEHVHAALSPYWQAGREVHDQSHNADQCWIKSLFYSASEETTDHLTSVIYDLIKEKF